jgi:hypothetical protein
MELLNTMATLHKAGISLEPERSKLLALSPTELTLFASSKFEDLQQNLLKRASRASLAFQFVICLSLNHSAQTQNGIVASCKPGSSSFRSCVAFPNLPNGDTTAPTSAQ